MNGMRPDIAYLPHQSAHEFLLHREVVRLEIAADVVLNGIQGRQIARGGGNHIGALDPDWRRNHRNTRTQRTDRRKRRSADDIELDLTGKGLHLPSRHVDRVRRQRVSGADHEGRSRPVRNSDAWSKDLARNVDTAVRWKPALAAHL